jgi:hypothetical protein
MRARAHEKRGSWALWNGAHLAALSAFALAQPIFDILGRNPTFFAVRGSTPTEIVLFALVVTFALPAAFLVLELAVSLLSRAAAQALHLLFVACFVSVVVLHVLTKSEAVSGPGALALAAAGGVAGAVVYQKVGAARSFLTVLAPAPVVFLGLFLVASPVSKLVWVETPVVRAATVKARTPVVLIVFDELNTKSLMNRKQRIDARRFPGFASLARRSTWYRNANTVYWTTEGAVPAILTGTIPVPGRSPVYAEYPRNLFTLLHRTYQLRVVETLTSLCPPSMCRKVARGRSHSFAVDDSVGSLASDTGVLYLHLVVPEPYVEHVPSIDNAWGNFTRGGEAKEPPVRRSPSGGFEPCGRGVCEFTDLLSPSKTQILYFLHTALPHTPYVYLPSGRRYSVDFCVLRGNSEGVWVDRFGALESNQRYLLQLGYTDKALSLILRKLRASGIYDKALVIVTADHGVSFTLGAERRGPTALNLADIAFVPLFVKLPLQRKSHIDDSFVRTVDILPTIARVLRTTVPWPIAGKSLIGRRLPSDGNVSVLNHYGTPVTASLAALRAQRSRDLLEQAATFGTGSFAAVYRIGPHRELVGRRVTSLRVRMSSGARAQITDASLLDAVDPTSEILPSYIEGQLTGMGSQTADVAIAVNGRVEAVTRTFRQGGKITFSAFVPERSLRAGRNAVEIFRVTRKGSRIVLDELRLRDLELTLQTRNGRQTIESPGAKPIHVHPGGLRGTYQIALTQSGVIFSGRATTRGGQAGARLIAVFVDDHAVFVGRRSCLRPHRSLGQPNLGRFGFTFELPKALLPDPGKDNHLRVFAIRGRFASELRLNHAHRNV